MSYKAPLKSVSNDCQISLVEYLEHMTEKSTNREGKTYYVEYTTLNKFAEKTGLQQTETKTRILSSENGIMMLDDNMKMYGDKKQIFVVLPKLKRIYLNNSDPVIFENNNSYQELIKIQKALLESAEKVSCSNESGMIIFKVTPGDQFVKSFKLKEQVVYYNEKQSRVFKVENKYEPGSKILKQSVQYDIMEFNSNRSLPNPMDKIFINGKIKSEFASFEIIDNRTNQK